MHVFFRVLPPILLELPVFPGELSVPRIRSDVKVS